MGSWAWLLPNLVCSPLLGTNAVVLTLDCLNLSAATAVGTKVLHDYPSFKLTCPVYSVHNQIVGLLLF
jgi:hypothetical protein